MTVLEYVKENWSEDELVEALDEEIMEWVDADTVEEEFDGDTYECYCETGRGEAESAIFQNLIGQLRREFGSDLTEEDKDSVYDWLRDEVNFNFN